MTLANQPTLAAPRVVSNRTKLIILYGLAFIFIAIGLVVTPSIGQLGEQIKIILTHPSRIDFDSFFWTGEFGAPFVQAGLSMLMTLLFYTLTKTEISGQQIAAFGMVTGFSFYGQNILNMWFTALGVFLYAIVFKRKFKDVSALAFFLACLTPFFSFHAFGQEKLGIGSGKALFVGAVLAVVVSFLAAIFASYFPRLHGGYLLFNAGLAGGWAAMMVASLLKAIGLGMENPGYGESYLTGQNGMMMSLLAFPFIYLLVAGVALGGFQHFKELFWYKSPGGSHVEKFGFAACLIKMGVMGFLAVGYVVLVGGDINGAVFACIWATVGFSANGSTLRTQLPLMVGIALGAFITGGLSGVMAGDLSFVAGGLGKLSARGMILCALFTCGVAPIVGNFGLVAGILVGITHIVVVPNIPPLHGWMLLYNNGFSLGLITVLLYPIYSRWAVKEIPADKVPLGLPK